MNTLFNWKKGTWPAKCMLFGEYGVLRNGSALGIQLSGLTLSLQPSKEAFTNNTTYETLCNLWERIPSECRISFELLKRLEVESTIPQGIGLGSSAALCLSVLEDAESSGCIQFSNFQERMNTLIAMESCFHGQSSGVDPLIVAASTPIWVQHGKDALLKVSAATFQQPFGLALLDIGPRMISNQEWISKICKRLDEDKCWGLYKSLSLVSALAMIRGQQEELQDAMITLSQVQQRLGLLDKTIWKRYIHDPGVIGVKAMGSGGGGSLLIITEPDALHRIEGRFIWRGLIGESI